MSQSDFGTINPDTKGGSELASDLNNWRDALHSMHSGSTAPTYVATGMTWLDTTAALNIVKIYDGSAWLNLFRVDTTNDAIEWPSQIIRGTATGTTADSAANMLVIDHNGNSGISILSSASNNGRIYFGDTASATVGVIQYGHYSGQMRFDAETEYNWDIGGSNAAWLTTNGFTIGTSAGVEARITASAAGSTQMIISDNTASGFAADSIRLDSARAGNSAYNFLRGRSNVGTSTDVEFKLSGDGNGTCDGSWTGGGADYAEFFEWADGNADGEDRRGVSVCLIDDKIAKAADNPDLPIIGVVSVNPSVVGDGDIDRWKGKYLRDDFGAYIMEDYDVVEWTDADGADHSYVVGRVPKNVAVPADAVTFTTQRRAVNPDYVDGMDYTPRADRQEWATIGLMGKLRLRKGQPAAPGWVKMRDVSDAVEEWLVK